MSANPHHVLIVEDDSGLADLLKEMLVPHGLQTDSVGSARECLDWLATKETDLLLIDYSLPDMTGAALVEELRRTDRTHGFVVTTGHGDEEVAVQLMKLGALDYLVKDARLFQRLPGVVLRALKEVATARRLERAEADLRRSHEMISKLTAQVPGVVYQYRMYPDGRSAFPFASPGMNEIYEVTPEEVREDATPVFGRLHPQDKERVVKVILESAANQNLFHCEFRVQLPRQGLRWRMCDATPERLADGSTLWYGIITDITERKQAEAALLQSEERFRKVSMVSSDFVYSCREDADGSYALDWIVGATERITGYSADELKAMRCWSGLVLAEDLPRFKSHVSGLPPGEQGRCELRLRRPNGSIVWVASEARCEQGPEGTGSRTLHGALSDITERKLAEAALARDEAELSAIYDSAPVMLLLLDRTLTLRRVNRAAVEFFGKEVPDASVTCGQLIGCLNAVDDACDCGQGPDDQACRLRQIIVAGLQDGRSCQRVEVVPRVMLNGAQCNVTMLASVAPVTVEGEVLVLLSLEDISQQKLSEAQIREQAALLDVTRDAIVVVDLEGRVNYWNRGAEELYGWAAAEAKGVRFESLVFDPAVRVEALAAWQAIRRDGRWSGELRQRHRSGEVRTTLCRGVLVFGPGGGVHSMLFTASDITEAKRMEVQFLRAQRLDSLGSLAGGVAHDLNNVFTPIMMSIEMLRATGGADRDRELIDLLDESARRGADIVRQLLMFGRGSDSPRGEVQVAMLVREVRRMMQETFPKNIDLAVDAADDLWTVLANHTQLHQVLLNLCVNARDAMAQGGRIALTAENVVVGAELAAAHGKSKPGPHVRLRVVDTGSGIPAELLERIFDPFFTTKPFGHGTGLGLSTALGIVRSHGGFITVNSKPGVGSEFGVYLPAHDPEKGAAGDRQAVAAQQGRNELVLVVDDEVNIQTMLEMALTRKGYRVAKVSDGLEAVAFFAERGAEVDVVVTDMMMPRADGLSTVRSLRTLCPRLPVVAISGVPGHRIELEALPAPRVRFLPKPFGVEDLLLLVREALDDSPPAAPPS
jgi:two-component system cell cycle sensor histidine kinase/response regulator CckA